MEDQRLRLVLVVIAVMYVAVGFLVAIPRIQQPAVNPSLALLGVLGGGLVACVVLLNGMRAASRQAMVRYWWSIAAFSIWNGLVIAVSLAIGWWGSGMPGFHFTVTTIVAALPLVAAAALMGFRRR